MSEPLVLAARTGPVLRLTVNRPAVLNALDAATLSALDAALDGAGDARAIVLTGSGDRAFVAGADVAAMAELSAAEALAFARAGQRVMRRLELLPQPVIAAVNGFALGGGCELALACDLVFASRAARFAQPEVKLGVIPGFGGTQRLVRRVGPARARELIFGGELIGAEEALRIGLVNAVVEPAELLARAHQAAEAIAARGPLAIAAAKRVLLDGADLPLEQACHLEAAEFAALFATADQREGMRAFLDKRPARFEGR